MSYLKDDNQTNNIKTHKPENWVTLSTYKKEQRSNAAWKCGNEQSCKIV